MRSMWSMPVIVGVVAASIHVDATACSETIDSLQTTLLMAPGEVDVPTNAFLSASGRGVFDVAFVRRIDDERVDAEDADPEDVQQLDITSGLSGDPELRPNTRYGITGPSLVEEVVFVTGDGDDVTPPAPPEVTLDAYQTAPGLGIAVDSCGGGALSLGRTTVELRVDGASDDAVGFFVIDDVTGRHFGTDFVYLSSDEFGGRDVVVVAVDRAGNESAPTTVYIDFGGPGGCTQGGLAPAALLALPLLLFRRRRRA